MVGIAAYVANSSCFAAGSCGNFFNRKVGTKVGRNWVEILDILQREEEEEQEDKLALIEEFEMVRETNAADILKDKERERVLRVQRCYSLQRDAPHRLPACSAPCASLSRRA